MPTPYEEELLTMARAQSRTAQPETHTPKLPDLRPEMLMSAAGQQEFRAARGSGALPPPRFPDSSQARPTPRENFNVDLTDDGSMELSDEDLSPPIFGGRQASQEPSGLESLFMNREAQEAASMGFGTSASPTASFGIEFESELDVSEGRGVPNPRARWQIGRESPPRARFDRTPHAGPSDGVVVRSLQNGNWAPQERQAPTIREARVAALEASPDMRTVTPPAPTGPVSSRYDRIFED